VRTQEPATFVAVDFVRGLLDGCLETDSNMESKTPKDSNKALVLRTSQSFSVISICANSFVFGLLQQLPWHGHVTPGLNSRVQWHVHLKSWNEGSPTALAISRCYFQNTASKVFSVDSSLIRTF